MGDEHLDIIPEKESNEFIKSSVENLVPNPSESEDLSNIGGIWRVVPRNYNPKRERFLIASRFPTSPFTCAFFSLRATETSSSKLARDQTSSTNPTPKGRIRRSSKQKVENSHFEEHLTPVAMMTDNRTMAEMLRAACRWLEKEPPHSITTWDDLVSKFINEFFPPSRTTNLRNEILNFQQKFDESFHEAWERYKDLLRACPHHGFTELHQLDTFYNALNPADQDFLNAAAGGNLLEKSPQDALTIIKNKSKVKAVEEIYVTCGGAHPYYQCLAAGGNTFPEYRDNIQGYVSAATGNYNQGNPGYSPQGVANQMHPPGKIRGCLDFQVSAVLVRFSLPVESPPNPSTSNLKRRNRRHSKQPFILEETPLVTMANQHTMAELLRAPTEGYTEAIVVSPILAEQFELKHSLINMMTPDQFFRLEKDNPHDYIR
nr:reverse transcriptase domain-containing protein [Tanacetum cinerariifolium]